MNLKDFYNRIGDYDNAMERFGGNEKMLSKFVKRFPSDRSYESLVRAYEHNDDTTVYRSATTLCEVCGSLAFTEMGKTTRVIVDAYRTGEAATRGIMNLPVLMNTLAAQYEAVIEAISNLE